MSILLQANEEFARTAAPMPLGLPRRQVILVTCLDHRIDPAAVFGFEPGDVPVIRNAGGRVTHAVMTDIAFLAFLAGQLGAGGGPRSDPWLEVAVVHHTQCGTAFLADPSFRAGAAEVLGIPDDELAAAAVAEPSLTVRADVGRLLDSASLPAGVTASGHVLDLSTGRVTTIVPGPTSATTAQPLVQERRHV